jgi:hypothetical protein
VYVALLIAHSAWRWVVLAAGIAAIAATFRPDVASPARASVSPLARLFSVSLDIQVLLGALLYLVFSPLTTISYMPPEGTSLPFELRFFAEYHVAAMLGAFLFIHAAAPLIRRADSDAARRRRARVVYGVTWLLVVSATPWSRPLLRF